MEKEQFVLGTGTEILTPSVGGMLYGYSPRPSTSVHDDLRCDAVALGHGKPTALFISFDLCSIIKTLSLRIRELLEKETGIPANAIILAAIHTHSGPAMNTTVGWGETDTAYIEEILIPRTVAAAKKAIAAAQPAVMGIGTTESDVGINRRQINENGQVILGQNPWGSYDPTMTVLAFRTPDGKPLANIVHYGAHATASGANDAITRDWPGFMVDRLERESGAVSMFVNGCMGDVGPRLPNGKTVGAIVIDKNGKRFFDIRYAEELGCRAGFDAVRAYRSIKEYREVDFRSISDVVSIPHRPLASEAELERQIRELGDPEKLGGLSLLTCTTLQKRLEIVRSGKTQEPSRDDEQVQFALNSVVLVPFPYEMFSETTLRLRAYSPFQHTICISNANGAYAYLPSRDQLCRGGYEVDQFNYRYPEALVENADDYIIAENLRIMKRLL